MSNAILWFFFCFFGFFFCNFDWINIKKSSRSNIFVYGFFFFHIYVYIYIYVCFSLYVYINLWMGICSESACCEAMILLARIYCLVFAFILLFSIDYFSSMVLCPYC